MKKYPILFTLLFLFSQLIFACPVCEKNQPKITMGLTHGAGPNSNWDWVIIGVMSVITIATLIYSIKFLVFPGEKSANHIKRSILRESYEAR